MKNCILYTFYGHTLYEELLLLSLKSLSKYFSKQDIYVFTDQPNNKLQQYCNIEKYDFFGDDVEKMSVRHLIASKLLNEYKNLLHLDIDTISINNPESIFKEIEDNKILVASEYPFKYDFLKINMPHVSTTMSIGDAIDDNWAGRLLTQNEKNIYKGIPSICAGVYAANSSVKDHFLNIYNYILFYNKQGFKGTCLDQHAFCKYLIINNLYDFKLQKYVSHQAKDMSLEIMKIMKINNFSILHFAGGVTPYNKINKMLECHEELNK